MNQRVGIIARGVAVIGGTTAMIVGATFAAGWEDTATLSANQIVSGTVDLQIAKPGDAQWNDSEVGYNFKLKPGTSDPYVIRFNNAGDTPMTVSTHIPNLVLHDVDATKVKVHIYAGTTPTGTDVAGGATLATVMNTDVTFGSPLLPNVEQDYTMTLESLAGAVTTGPGTSDQFDLVFNGTATEVPAP